MVVRGSTRITRKGQITVPAEIRAAAGLVEGDRIEVRYDEASKTITIEAPGSVVRSTAGLFRHAARPELLGEEKRVSRQAAAEAAARRDERSKG